MSPQEKLHTTNYYNTLIEIAEDCPVQAGEIPPTKADGKSIAGMQYELIHPHPYQYTSDDVLFLVFAERSTLTEADYPEARQQMFSKGQACLRSSPLSKRYGWGIHSNSEGKIALYGIETKEYKALQQDSSVKKLESMRSKR